MLPWNCPGISVKNIPQGSLPPLPNLTPQDFVENMATNQILFLLQVLYCKFSDLSDSSNKYLPNVDSTSRSEKKTQLSTGG